MHRINFFSAILVANFLLLGGCSDYSFEHVGGESEPLRTLGSSEPEAPGPTGPPSPGPSQLQPHRPPGPEPIDDLSPWGSIEPGEFPEEYFAVVWNDPRGACLDCFTPTYFAPRYDIVDVLGRVLVSLGLPSWGGIWVGHHSIEPAGPGRFLAVSTAFGNDERPWKAWFGDGPSETVEVVLEWGWDGSAYLPVADREIEFPEWLGNARVMPDPNDEDRIYVLPQNTSMYANPLLGTLYSIDVRDPEAPVVTWNPEDMIDPSFVPEWGWAPWFPWYSGAFYDGEKTVIVLGLEVFTEDGDLRRVLVDFSPELGQLDWELDLTDQTMQRDIVVRPPMGEVEGRALFHSSTDLWCPEAGFSTWDGQDLAQFGGSSTLLCTRLGPMLDDLGETFLYYGADEEREFELQERLVVSHRGQDVWELNSFQLGLNAVPIDIHSLVRLEAP